MAIAPGPWGGRVAPTGAPGFGIEATTELQPHIKALLS